MEYHWALFTLVTLLSVQPGCSSRPIISPEPPQLVVPLDGPLSLHCHGNGSVRWQREDRGQGRRVRGENRQGRVSIIHLPRAQPPHMGRYTCVEEDSGDKSSIYVFVKDPDHAFRKSIVFDIVAGAGDSVSIPCLATDPGVTDLRLEMCDGQPLPSSLRYSSSTETGVTVGTVQKAFEGCYICTGMLGGATVTSGRYQLNVRLAPDTVAEVLVRERGPVLLTQGERLSLSCSTSNVNSDIQLRWFTPPGVQASLEKTSQILTEPISHVRTATLHVTAVTAEASGLYRCEAQNERGTSSSSISVNVYERGFINVTGWQNETVRVRAGESLRLLIEMEAYPRPHTLSWAHAGHQLANTSDHVITTHTLGHSYSSELHLVRLKVAESGIYAFLASNGDATISRTFTVHVISKPEIVSHEGPVDGQVRCVAEGYPTPQITWYYCDQPHVRCSSLLNATQEEEDVVTVTLTKPAFGKREVESRLNISKTHTTLECVATVEGEQVYTLFSISDRSVPHQLFTPLLISFIAAAILLCLILLVLSYKYMQKPKFQIQWKVIEGIHGNNYVYIDPTQLPYNQQWEFPRDKLRFGKTLGSGAFGKVVEATAYGLADTVMTVAVKMLKPSAHATEKEALMSELKVLSYLGNHINIVNLLGACTIGGPTLVITEYCCYGDLLNFLRRKRDTFCYSGQGDECYYRNVTLPPDAAGDNQNGYMTMRPTAGLLTTEKRVSLHKGGCSGEGGVVAEVVQEDDLTLDTEDLLSFSYQVAKGMDFLTSKNCIHRDLAARNILITEGRVAKICDFGLARDITTDSNYVVKGNARLPVKWMSPESIFECVYTFESDVWSYGILLWEIFSLGSSPYPGMPVDAQFYKMIKEGYRMNSPEFAPSQMYEMMRTCWDKDPFKRPAFGKVVERIEQQLSDRTKHIYLNFSSRVPMGTGAPEDQNSQLRCLYSVGGGPAPTQPLLANDNVFLEGTEPRHQRV